MKEKNNKNTLLVVIVFLLLSLVSCSSSLDQNEYVSWMQDESNGFHQKRTINSTTVEVQYGDSSYQRIKNKTKNPIAHVFHIHINSENNNELFDAMAIDNYNYFSFSLDKDIYIETKNKTYTCKLFHYEQSHGKLGELYFIVGFELADLGNEPIQFVINPQPFQTGPIKFTFDLNQIPSLSN